MTWQDSPSDRGFAIRRGGRQTLTLAVAFTAGAIRCRYTADTSPLDQRFVITHVPASGRRVPDDRSLTLDSLAALLLRPFGRSRHHPTQEIITWPS